MTAAGATCGLSTGPQTAILSHTSHCPSPPFFPRPPLLALALPLGVPVVCGLLLRVSQALFSSSSCKVENFDFVIFAGKSEPFPLSRYLCGFTATYLARSAHCQYSGGTVSRYLSVSFVYVLGTVGTVLGSDLMDTHTYTLVRSCVHLPPCLRLSA